MAIRRFLFTLLLCVGAAAEARGAGTLEVDSLIAKVGREAVLLSDLRRFADVDKVLQCAGVVAREQSLPSEVKPLLEIYVEEELLFLEARAKKTSTGGSIPETVQLIHGKSACRARWQKLGERYSKYWRTDTRAREGESLLVRELEKRVLVERFRRANVIADPELWKREAKTRHPVKIYLE